MKFKLSVMLSLVCLSGIGIQPLLSQTASLNISKWDGTNNDIELSSIKKITFPATNLIINYQNGNSENFSISAIRNMVFGSYSGLKETFNSTNAFCIYPNPSSDFISLKNLPDGNVNFSVYSISGTQIMNIQHYSGKTPIDISGLTKGIYIIKVNSQALKFIKL